MTIHGSWGGDFEREIAVEAPKALAHLLNKRVSAGGDRLALSLLEIVSYFFVSLALSTHLLSLL